MMKIKEFKMRSDDPFFPAVACVIVMVILYFFFLGRLFKDLYHARNNETLTMEMT